MGRRNVYIWVRTDLDWSKMDESALFAHNRRKFYHDDCKIAKKIENGMVVFKRVIASDFFEFRRAFAEISRQNLQDILDKGTISGVLYDSKRIAGLGDADLIIPTDDDDLIHTEIGEQLMSQAYCDVHIWNCVKFRDLNIRPWEIRESLKDKSLIKTIQPINTNNAAFSVRALRELIVSNQHVRHWEVGKELLRKRGLDYSYNDQICSVVNRNPFNATALIRSRYALKQQRIDDLKDKVKSQNVDCEVLCSEFGIQWALPYMRRIQEVYNKIEFK